MSTLFSFVLPLNLRGCFYINKEQNFISKHWIERPYKDLVLWRTLSNDIKSTEANYEYFVFTFSLLKFKWSNQIFIKDLEYVKDGENEYAKDFTIKGLVQN